MVTLGAKYQERLKELPGVLSYRMLTPRSSQEERYDARLRLKTTGGSHELLVQQLRSHVSRDMASHIANARRDSDRVLVLAPHIGAGVAATLAEAGLNYLDASGNCHISVPSFHVHVEGKNAGASPDAASAGIRGPGFQVLFAYLADPTLLDAPIRAVAACAGVSRQPVLALRQRLIREGYVLESPSRCRWHPRRREDALALWLHGYQTIVRGSLLMGAYRTRDKSPAELEARIAELFPRDQSNELRWGGAAAGFRLTGTYRGERTVVHLHSEPSDLARRLGGLSDRHGNLVVMRSFGLINWTRDRDTVHPLLVYSEMLSDGSERAREAAQELQARYLTPLWKEAR